MKKTLLLVFTLLFSAGAWAVTPDTSLDVDGKNLTFTWEEAYGPLQVLLTLMVTHTTPTAASSS